MKNILLLTDFSENSDNAITYALEFFKEETCHFYVMHVHKMGTYTTDDLVLASEGNIYDSIIRAPKDKLEAIVNQLKEEHKGDSVFDLIVEYNNFTDAINQAVVSKQIDVIVLGSNGKTGAREVIFGSNTINVIRKVKCQTLVVPENYNHKPVKNVLLALEPKDNLNEPVLSQLNAFIQHYNFNLNVLRIKPHKEESEYAFYDQSNLGDIPHQYFTINDVPLHHAINSFIQLKDIDMSVLFVKKESFFERFFLGSAKSKVSHSLHKPLLVFHSE